MSFNNLKDILHNPGRGGDISVFDRLNKKQLDSIDITDKYRP